MICGEAPSTLSHFTSRKLFNFRRAAISPFYFVSEEAAFTQSHRWHAQDKARSKCTQELLAHSLRMETATARSHIENILNVMNGVPAI